MTNPSLDASVAQAANNIKTWGAVAVIGAGASFGRGLPLVAQLPPLLWHAFDLDEVARGVLASTTGWSGRTGKELIGEDKDRLKVAYEVLENHPNARHHYQHAFSKLDKERATLASPVHLALAELLHRRLIQTVISFNWDTLLEASYRSLYGATLPVDGRWLHKPHGDATAPGVLWTLPHQAGNVPRQLLDQMEALRGHHPRVLLLVGYSESDEEVLRLLTGPLANQWKVVRVGPSASGEGAIAATADEALPLLRRSLCSGDEVSGWEYVTFNRKQDLASVLSGRRLGPQDVHTCPRLPEVDVVRQSLAATHAVILSGKSGGGKSITAYQATHDLTLGFWDKRIWEVVRLVEPERPVSELLDVLQGLPRPTVALVDDAQSVSPHLVRRLLDSTSDQLAALIVTTENGVALSSLSATSVEIVGSRAVNHLAQALKKRRSETLTAVRQFDDQVGDNHLDYPIEWRLEEASKCETPWQFAFALTGGWRRAKAQLVELREHDRADLLLAAVAAGQVTSLDSGASLPFLERCATELGQDHSWLERQLRSLQDRRLVWPARATETRFRCPHLQFSNRVLGFFFSYEANELTPDDRDSVCQLLRLALEMNPPLRGIAWLLNAVRFTDHFRWQQRNRTEPVLPDALWDTLCARCWQAASPIDRRDALYALTVLFRWHPDHANALRAHQSLLSQWLEDVTHEEAYAWYQLFGELRHDHAPLCAAICNGASAEVIAQKLSTMTWETASGWSYLLSTLGAWSDKKWFRRLRSATEIDKIRPLTATLHRERFSKFERLIVGMAWLNWNWALDMIEEALPQLAQELSQDPIEARRDIWDIIFTYLGYYHHFFRQGQPKPRQKRLLQKLARAIDWVSLGHGIPDRPGDWEDYSLLLDALLFALPSAERRRIERILEQQLDFERLDRLTQGLWASIPRELEMLLLAFDFGPNREPARSWVRRHAPEIERISSKLIHIAPDVALAKIKEGQFYSFESGGSNDIHWREAIADIVHFHQADPQATVELIEANHERMSRAFVNLIPTLGCEMLPMFLYLTRQIASSALNKALNGIDIQAAQKNWRERLSGKEVEQSAVSALLDAVEGTSSVGDELRALAYTFKQEFAKSLIDYRPEVQNRLVDKNAPIYLGDLPSENNI